MHNTNAITFTNRNTISHSNNNDVVIINSTNNNITIDINNIFDYNNVQSSDTHDTNIICTPVTTARTLKI